MVMKKNELYPLVNEQFANWKITIKLIGKSTMNEPFSIAL
jgi:hypothetical protein